MSEILHALEQVVGAGNVVPGEEWNTRAPVWETHQSCNARAVLRPSTTQQVAEIMKICYRHGQSVVPYGGLTNLVQGCVTTTNDLALSFERMTAIENVDTVGNTMTVQAGVTMEVAQARAEQDDLFFPVDIGARGTCMVGGNVATNAGGTKVIRYGMMRGSVLGLEVVLADGTIIDSMNHFLKNNSGFDVKQLFIGSEGTLGLITRIVFRLEVQSRSHNVALVACDDYAQVLAVLIHVRRGLGAALCGFEVMWDGFFSQVVQPLGELSAPIEAGHAFNVIIEAMGTTPGADDDTFEALLSEMFESGLIVDGAIAKSASEREAIWAIRHDVEWVVKDAFVFDVSLPTALVAEYVDIITRKIAVDFPEANVVAFGHLGDNNIHISVLGVLRSEEHTRVIEKHVYDSLRPYRGAISAEHGIGLEKKAYLSISRSEAEIELMRTMKRSLDPKNILNPGKVISLG